MLKAQRWFEANLTIKHMCPHLLPVGAGEQEDSHSHDVVLGQPCRVRGIGLQGGGVCGRCSAARGSKHEGRSVAAGSTTRLLKVTPGSRCLIV